MIPNESIAEDASLAWSGKPGFKPTAISLFAGAGGCSLGFQQAGFDVRFATDIDGDAVESYRRNFARTPCEVADVRDLGAEKCGIVTFTVEGLEAEQVKMALSEEKVKVNVSVTTRHSTLLDMDARGLHSMVRASVHYYNSDDEVDRFCGLIRRIATH